MSFKPDICGKLYADKNFPFNSKFVNYAIISVYNWDRQDKAVFMNMRYVALLSYPSLRDFMD